jgi:hypothetical protein
MPFKYSHCVSASMSNNANQTIERDFDLARMGKMKRPVPKEVGVQR